MNFDGITLGLGEDLTCRLHLPIRMAVPGEVCIVLFRIGLGLGLPCRPLEKKDH